MVVSDFFFKLVLHRSFFYSGCFYEFSEADLVSFQDHTELEGLVLARVCQWCWEGQDFCSRV